MTLQNDDTMITVEWLRGVYWAETTGKYFKLFNRFLSQRDSTYKNRLDHYKARTCTAYNKNPSKVLEHKTRFRMR